MKYTESDIIKGLRYMTPGIIGCRQCIGTRLSDMHSYALKRSFFSTGSFEFGNAMFDYVKDRLAQDPTWTYNNDLAGCTETDSPLNAPPWYPNMGPTEMITGKTTTFDGKEVKAVCFQLIVRSNLRITV